MSDSVRPHRWQPTRLRHPWDSPGKNTGVGCRFLLLFPEGTLKVWSWGLSEAIRLLNASGQQSAYEWLSGWTIKRRLRVQVQKGGLVLTYSTGTLLNIMWQPGYEGSLGEIEYVYMYGWISLLFTWNYHNIVNQPCCYSVIKAYLTLCNPLDCSMPDFSVFHCLLEFAWIHVHLSQWCYLTISSSAIPFSFAFNLSQHQSIHPKINLKV